MTVAAELSQEDIKAGLARLKWDVSAYKDQIASNLGSEHSFDGKFIKER